MSGFAADTQSGFTRELNQYRHDVEDWSSRDVADWKTSHEATKPLRATVLV